MKKKILILSSIILVIVICVCITIIIVNNKNTKIDNKSNEEFTSTNQESIIDQNNIDNIVAIDIETEEKELQDTEEKSDKDTKDKTIENTKEETIVKEVNKNNNSEQIKQATNNAVTNNITLPVKPTENVENKEEPKEVQPTIQPTIQPTEQPIQNIPQTNNQTESVAQQKVEKYVVNNDMINRMKTYIENNPSEEMQTYGFNVVVDSSIKELTNQFTFTEKRVNYMLLYKAGTIRIYAENYYVNDQLIMTECYIL